MIRYTFVLILSFVFSLFVYFSAFASPLYDPTPTFFPTITPLATVNLEFNFPSEDLESLDNCPPYIEGEGVITPSVEWLLSCGHCLSTSTPFPTSTPVPTSTPDPFSLTSTAVFHLTTSPTPTLSPTPTFSPTPASVSWGETAFLQSGALGTGLQSAAIECTIHDAVYGYYQYSFIIGDSLELHLPASGSCIVYMTSYGSYWDSSLLGLGLSSMNYPSPGDCGSLSSVGSSYYGWPPETAGLFPVDIFEQRCYGDVDFISGQYYLIDSSQGVSRHAGGETIFEIGEVWTGSIPTPTPTLTPTISPTPGSDYCASMYSNYEYMGVNLGSEEYHRDCYETPSISTDEILSGIFGIFSPQFYKDVISYLIPFSISVPAVRFCFSYREFSLVIFGIVIDLTVVAFFAIVFSAFNSLTGGLVGRWVRGNYRSWSPDSGRDIEMERDRIYGRKGK